MNDEFLNIFRKEMEDIAEKAIKKYIKKNNLEKPYDGTVVSVGDDGLCRVDLGFVVLEDLKNLSGESLAEEDSVTVYARGGNINNAYVGLKF